MPYGGDYAVYISYKSLPNSARDVTYTVNSLSGARQFRVDQTMAGGVWVYLGTFPLAQGMNKAVVEVSNLSEDKNAVITADAISVGGGKGNVVRRVALPTEENLAIVAEQKANGVSKRVIGIELKDKAIPRHGYAVLKDGVQVGEVTTGYHCLSVDKSVCMALVETPHAKLGTELEVQIRKKTFPGVVVKKRFYDKHYKKD